MIIQDCPEWWRRNTIPPIIVAYAKQHVGILVEYLEADRRSRPKFMGQVVFGPPGVGKTSMILTMFTMVMSEGRVTARYVKVRNMIRALRDTWKPGSGTSEGKVLEGFTEPRLLLLDDVGVQAGSENERNLIYDVIAEREDQNKPTYITTNHDLGDPEGFKAFGMCVGTRVIDRYSQLFVDGTEWGTSLRRKP